MHFLEARSPDGMRLYAIGDVHGRLDLLKAMHARIRGEIVRDGPADWRIIHVGDYVDRGPDSSGVLQFLIDRIAEDSRVIALRGNHDEGFEHFMAGRPNVRTFTDHGGDATCRSYGVEPDFRTAAGRSRTRNEMAKAVPASHLDFLQELRLSVEFGDFFFCHAGIRPDVPLEAQNPHDLIWIRNAFLDHPGPHPRVIVHGHTPSSEAEVLANRVNVDTLAWRSGRLTALVVDGKEKRLLEVSG